MHSFSVYLICFLVVLLSVFILCTYSYHIEHFVSKQSTNKQSHNRKLVIVSSHYNESLEWLQNKNIEVVICSKILPSPKCPCALNKGNEASAYLSYIVHNYDNLPTHIAFIHGHSTAWHQKPKDFYNFIVNCTRYKKYGYVSLNGSFIYDRLLGTNNAAMDLLESLWDAHFKPYLNIEVPQHLLHDCCAQFIVSKQRILLREHAAYKHWLELCMTFEDDRTLSVAFEYIWHVIFGEPNVVNYIDYLQTIKKHCHVHLE